MTHTLDGTPTTAYGRLSPALAVFFPENIITHICSTPNCVGHLQTSLVSTSLLFHCQARRSQAAVTTRGYMARYTHNPDISFDKKEREVLKSFQQLIRKKGQKTKEDMDC